MAIFITMLYRRPLLDSLGPLPEMGDSHAQVLAKHPPETRGPPFFLVFTYSLSFVRGLIRLGSITGKLRFTDMEP